MVLVFLIGKKSVNKIDREIRLSNHISRFVGDTNEINAKKLRYLTLRGVTVNDSVDVSKKVRHSKNFSPSRGKMRENFRTFWQIVLRTQPTASYIPSGCMTAFGRVLRNKLLKHCLTNTHTHTQKS